MPTDADFSDSGMTREDRILARVVLDLGLAKVSDIEGAMGKVKESGAPLARVLQETGCLKPRFLAAVEKVVKSRLATTKASGSERPSARKRAQRPPSSRQLARPTTSAEKQQVLPSLGTPHPPGESGRLAARPPPPGRVDDVVRTTRQAQGLGQQPPDEQRSEGDPPPSSQYMKVREARRRRRAKGWGRDGDPGT